MRRSAKRGSHVFSQQKAVLFDIDGTLMRAPGLGRVALAEAAARVYGLPLDSCRAAIDSIDFRGATDGLIFAEFGSRLGLGPIPRQDPLSGEYVRVLERLCQELQLEPLPGAAQLVTMLAGMGLTRVGILTGNLRAAARIKLQAIGLEALLDGPCAFADDGLQRREVAAAAFARTAALGARPWQTLVIGDTAADVAAAHHMGGPAVAVASGWTPLQELHQCGAQLVLADLSDPGPVLELLARL